MDWDFALTAFVTLFVVIDPPGVMVIFASLAAGASGAWRWLMAVKATVAAAFILLLFAFGGEWLLSAIGIGIPAFRTAGGILLFLIGLEMIFEQRTQRRSRSAEQATSEYDQLHPEHVGREDISIFPLAIPLIAGPGAIASMVLLMGTAEGDTLAQMSIFGALTLVLLLNFVLLVFAGRLMGWLGESASILIARIMGILLCALSVQFVFDGVKAGLLS